MENYRQQNPDKFVNLGRNKDNMAPAGKLSGGTGNSSADSADYYMFARSGRCMVTDEDQPVC